MLCGIQEENSLYNTTFNKSHSRISSSSHQTAQRPPPRNIWSSSDEDEDSDLDLSSTNIANTCLGTYAAGGGSGRQTNSSSIRWHETLPTTSDKAGLKKSAQQISSSYAGQPQQQRKYFHQQQQQQQQEAAAQRPFLKTTKINQHCSNGVGPSVATAASLAGGCVNSASAATAAPSGGSGQQCRRRRKLPEIPKDRKREFVCWRSFFSYIC